jgi:hypothetical protein
MSVDMGTPRPRPPGAKDPGLTPISPVNGAEHGVSANGMRCAAGFSRLIWLSPGSLAPGAGARTSPIPTTIAPGGADRTSPIPTTLATAVLDSTAHIGQPAAPTPAPALPFPQP